MGRNVRLKVESTGGRSMTKVMVSGAFQGRRDFRCVETWGLGALGACRDGNQAVSPVRTCSLLQAVQEVAGP